MVRMVEKCNFWKGGGNILFGSKDRPLPLSWFYPFIFNFLFVFFLFLHLFFIILSLFLVLSLRTFVDFPPCQVGSVIQQAVPRNSLKYTRRGGIIASQECLPGSVFSAFDNFLLNFILCLMSLFEAEKS